MDTITNFEEKYLGSKSVDPNQTVNFGASLNLTKAVEEVGFSSGVWNDMIWILTSSFIIFTMQTGEGMLPERWYVSLMVIFQNRLDFIFSHFLLKNSP